MKYSKYEDSCGQFDRGCCSPRATEAKSRRSLGPAKHRSKADITTQESHASNRLQKNTRSSMANQAIDIASTIQSASIKQHPSLAHDLNPSTAASTKRPVSPTISISSDAESIPESALKSVPRRVNLPPLPDLRFEQSYLASLKGVESKWAIAWITMRDQVR